MREPAEGRGLTDFQLEVARSFFALPASDGFLLAGGGTLLANGLTDDVTLGTGGADVADVRSTFALWARALRS